MKPNRHSRVNDTNIQIINQLIAKRENLINTLKRDDVEINRNTKHVPSNKKHLGERAEAVYAAPVPRVHRGPLSAEENLQQWGARRSLPINMIRKIVADLQNQQQ